MARIAFIAESRAQRATPALAENLYRSTLFQKCRRYALKDCKEWYILSTPYRLLKPDTRIEPYQQTIHTLDSHARFDWAQAILQNILQLPLKKYDTLVILANSAYQQHLVPTLQARRYQLEIPLLGMNAIEQIRWLNQAINP